MPRAISYIMSVMLMTLIIAGLSFGVYLWATGEISTVRDLITGAMDAKIQMLKESMVVEHVAFGVDGDHVDNITVTVRNVGEVPIKIDSIYVNHTRYEISPPVTINPGKFEDLTVTFPSPLPLSSAYEVTVPTTRGNKVVGEYSP